MTNLRNLELEDLDAVASVHCAAFPDSALTKMGAEAVRRYYDWLMVGPHDAVNIGVFKDKELLGFCFGGIFRSSLGGFLEKNRNFLIGRVLLRPWLIFNPLFRDRIQVALRRMYGRFLPKPKTVAAPSPQRPRASFGILSIAVAPEYQGTGVASLLMNHSQLVAIERGFEHLHLTVHPDNQRAIRFYEKQGWSREGLVGEWTGLMGKDIPK